MKSNIRSGPQIMGALLLAGAMPLLAGGCNQQPGAPQPSQRTSQAAPVAVRTAPLQRGSIAQILSYTGEVRAKAQVAVVTKVSGRVERLLVEVGDSVEAGQTLALLEHEMLDAQVQQAQAGLSLARARLAGLEEGPRAEVVGQAEANLRLASARLAALLAGPLKAQVEAAQAAVRAAKNQLYAVEAQADSLLSRMGSGYTPEMKEAQAGTAYEQVRLAEAQLAALTAPPTPEQVDQAEAAVEAARQQLLLAQTPYTASDLEAARATVAQAQAALRLATLQQRDATVQSPISGTVSERLISQGDMASPAAPILVLIGQGIEVQVGVEEAMVSQVTVGKPVTVTVAAYPGLALAGRVASMSPSLDPRTRAALAKVEVEDSRSRLKPGMFAQASIVAASRSDALVAPKKAVLQRNQRQVIFVAAGGVASLREVQTGLSDGKNVEILSGLRDGDRIILSGLADLADGDPVELEGGSP